MQMPFGLSTDLFRSSGFRETKFLRISPEHILDFIAKTTPKLYETSGLFAFTGCFFRYVKRLLDLPVLHAAGAELVGSEQLAEEPYYFPEELRKFV